MAAETGTTNEEQIRVKTLVGRPLIVEDDNLPPFFMARRRMRPDEMDEEDRRITGGEVRDTHVVIEAYVKLEALPQPLRKQVVAAIPSGEAAGTRADPVEDVDFGQAMRWLKLGKKITRRAWDVTDQNHVLVFREDAIRMESKNTGMVYLPRTEDVLAEDWRLVVE